MKQRNRTSTRRVKTTSKTSFKKQSITPLKPFRKARTKIKKPKYLSLHLALSNTSQRMTPKFATPMHEPPDQNLHEDHNTNIADIFGEEGEPRTLKALLNDTVSWTSKNAEEEEGQGGLAYAGCGSGAQDSWFEHAALRKREREEREEKWVSMTEVLELDRSNLSTAAEEEVTSGWPGGGGLWLKLDYEEVLNAWCGKGPLYIQSESPQTVPDLLFENHHHFILPNHLSIGDKGHCRVPESSNAYNGGISVEIGGSIEGERSKMGLRKASVLRYKEKRQSRLFSKRIRYEVRKLNAEKRPRIKGRFVKRSID